MTRNSPDSNSSRDERMRSVRKMLTSFELEGMKPSPEDEALLTQYVAGEIGLSDLYAQAMSFAAAHAEKC